MAFKEHHGQVVGFNWSTVVSVTEGSMIVSDYVALQRCEIFLTNLNVAHKADVVSTAFTDDCMFCLLKTGIVFRFDRCSLFSSSLSMDIKRLHLTNNGDNLWVSLSAEKSIDCISDDLQFSNFGVRYLNQGHYANSSESSGTLLAACDSRAFVVTHSEKLNKPRLYCIHEQAIADFAAKLLQLDVPDAACIVQISCGKAHILLLDSLGRVHSFGNGSRGELGHGTVESEPFPVVVDTLSGIPVKMIAAGGWHSAALTTSGDLYTWGWNESGQLAIDNKQSPSERVPTSIDLPDEQSAKSVACGSRHTIVLLENGQVYSCGIQNYDTETSDSTSNKNGWIQIERRMTHVLNVHSSDWTTVIKLVSPM